LFSKLLLGENQHEVSVGSLQV